jgi:hypothetical protein
MHRDEEKATFSFLPSAFSLDTPDSPDWVPLAERSPMARARWFAFYGPGKTRPGRPERALTRPDENPAVASPMLYMLLEQQERDKENETFKSSLKVQGA